VLLAPTELAMRAMLAICDRFATEINVTFNANKSKCIMFKVRSHRSARDRIVLTPQFLISGHIVENVLTWPHLRHILRSNMLDGEGISEAATVSLARLTLFCVI
jgi:hypothetical protein